MRAVAVAVAIALACLPIQPALAQNNQCYKRAACSERACPLRLPASVPHLCRFMDLPWGEIYWTTLGTGCTFFAWPPGAVGADWCVAQLAYVDLDDGNCEIWSLAQVEGPSCCMVGCPPNAPGCHAQLDHH